VTTDHADRELINRLLGPFEPEVSCEECFELLDRYVDLELAGEDAAATLPGMRAHLQGCPACQEDHQSLRDLVAATDRTGREWDAR
jgi:anti-sigma factor RsiW